jgi:hypothetical protein
VQAVFVAVIAVVGTLGGAVVTGFLQRRQLVWGEERAKDEVLRQTRVAAYVGFAQLTSEFSAAQIERWIIRRDHTRDSDQYRQAREETHRTGSAARGGLFRLQLVIDDEELLELAHEALSIAFSVERADNQDDLNKRSRRSREAIDAFVEAAGRLSQVR